MAGQQSRQYRKHTELRYIGTACCVEQYEECEVLLIRQGLLQSERLLQLYKLAITQMKSLLASNAMKKLKKKQGIVNIGYMKWRGQYKI